MYSIMFRFSLLNIFFHEGSQQLLGVKTQGLSASSGVILTVIKGQGLGTTALAPMDA